MITVSKSRLKAHMLDLFRQAEKTGDEIIVTHHQKPVLRITPYHAPQRVEEIFADWRGKASLPKAALLESTESEWELS